MASRSHHTTPIVIAVVGVVGIVAIVLAIVLTRTSPPVVATAPNPPAVVVDAAVAVVPPPVPTPPDVPTTPEEPEKPKPTPLELLRTKICARAATGSGTCSAAENCSIDKRPKGYCGCVTQMAPKHAAIYLAWYTCYAGCNPAAQYDGCRADCNRTRGAACSKQ